MALLDLQRGVRFERGKQIIGVHNSAFARLHAAFRQRHVTVRKMFDLLGPFKAEQFQDLEELLEMEVLLVGRHDDGRVDSFFLDFFLGEIQILRDVERRAVRPKHDFVRQFVRFKIGEDSAGFVFLKDAFLETEFDDLFSFLINFGFLVFDVELETEPLIGFVLSGFAPAAQGFPKRTRFFVVLFPQPNDVMRFLFQVFILLGSLLVHHVQVAEIVVAFLAKRFGRRPVPPLLVGDHRLRDRETAVVQEQYARHLLALGLVQVRQRRADQAVAHVAEVQRLVVIRADVFDHDHFMIAFAVAVGLRSLEYGRGRVVDKIRFLKEKIEIRAFGLDAFEAFRQLHLGGHISRDFGRRGLQFFCQRKTRKREVSVFGQLRIFQSIGDDLFARRL